MERTNGKKVVTSVMLAVIVLAIAFMALFAMSPAITAKATPTAYEGGAKLDLDALQVGDVISGAYGTVTGQTITNVRFAAGRYSCGAQPITTLPSDWGPINTGEAETSLVKNGGTVCFHSNYSFDFYPLTENGELGTAWVVTEIKDGAVYFGGQGSGNDYSSLTVNLSKDYLNSLWGGTSDEALDFPTDALSITPAFPYIVDDSHEYARANYFAEISEINQKEAVTLYIRCDVGVNASTLQALFEKGETLAVTFNGSQWKSYEDPDSSGGGAHYYEHHYIYDFGVISIRYVDWESEMATDAYELFINIYGDGQSGGQGGNDPQPAGHTHDEITFTAWESNNELPNSEGNYYLTTDVTLSSTWNAPSGTTNLCLNGHGIKWAGPAEYYGVFEVRDGATLNLYDCSDTLHYFDLSETNTLLAINVNDTAGSNSFRGGYITGGNRTSGAGGFIWVENATFNMYGGTILGNAAGSGGAVYISENESAFNMYGGAIIYNHSLGNGGAIRLNYGATFTLYGGEIKNNYAKENGGAVDLRSSSKLNLYGGKISANSAGQNGGGAYKATSYSTINLSGAPVVKDNFANGVKDDVYLYGDGILNVVDPLTDGASVGVSMESGTGVFTSGWSTHMGETNPATIFISTNLDYGVALQNGEAAILDEDPNASTVTLGAGLLYVGGVDIVTAENYTVNGTGGGKAVLSETDGKLFLTLTDYVYEGPGYSYWGEGGGIDYRGGGTLTIILVGNSSITKADDSAIGRSHGIYFDNGTLTIDGTGSLTISFSSDRSGWKSNGIFNESGSFVMNGGTVVSNAGVGDESAGIYAGGGITFNGGTFTGNGNYTTDYESRGIYSGSITVNGGTVCGTAPLDNNNEARAFDGSVTINAGTLTAYGNPSFSWGVQCGANSTWTILAGDDEASATQVGGVDGNEKYVHIVAQSAGAHAHDYETVWTTDDVGHWHACVGAGDCDEPKADFGEHSYSDDISDVAYYTCSVCHYENATRKSAYEAQQQPPVIYVASVTKGDVTTEYTSFGEALNAWTADSTLTLLNDVTSDRINVTGGVTKTLDLNGKTITLVATNVNEQRVLCITGAGTTLNLIDSSGTNAGRLTGVNPTNDDGWSGAIYINSGSTVNMYGGTVTGNSTIRGAGVWIDGRGHAGNATFNMYGGLITGNTSIKPEGTLEAGYSIGGGGGVYVGAFLGTATSGEGQFNMYGGTITGNAGTNGDNVYVDYGVMNMVGGTIDGGFAHSDYVTVIFDANGGTGTMSDQYVKRGTNTQVKDNTYYDLYAVEQDGYAREGYILLGWNTQADGKGTKYAVGTDNVNFGEDTTLYAQWTPIAVACITVDGETTEYASLIEAYEACPEGGTIVLIADVDISNLGNEVYVTVEKDLNIDLHGHTLKFKYTPTSAQIILSGGHVLTIDNSVPEKGGVKGFIDVEDDGSYVLLRNCRLIFGKTALASTADINHIEPFFTVDNIDEDGFLSLIRPMTDDELVELTEELIDEIPDPPVNNDETKDAIDEARKVYDMLPEDKKEEVENRQKLFDAEDEYARLNNTKWSIKIRAKSTSSVDYTAYIDEGETIVRVYDVTLYRIGIENGVEQDPELAQPSDIKADATISVKLTVPDVLVGKNFRILHVHSADDHAFVEYTKDADGKHIVIKGIDRLSDFAFVALTSDLTPSGQGGEGQGNEGQGGEGQGEQGGQEEVPTVEPEPEITKEDDPTKENLPLVPQGGQGGEEGQGGQGEEGQSGQGGKDEPAKPTASVALEDTDPEDAVGVTVEVEVKTEVSEEVTQSENNVLSGSLQSDDEIAIVYEVKLIRTTIENGIEIREEIQPSDIKPGTVVVINMVIPEELRGKPFKLLHIHSEEDVKEVTAYTVSEDGTTLTVRVDRLSEFAFVGKKVADAEVIIEPNKISDGAIAGIVIGGSFGILFLGLLIFFLLG
ncbi:MAG: InlB B-repeat-containing protein [Clostridia bacterium]|nr:InlB B-repeat-containing protein [Clostridia bacterium]